MLDFAGGIMECSFWNKNEKIKKLFKHRIENNMLTEGFSVHWRIN